MSGGGVGFPIGPGSVPVTPVIGWGSSAISLVRYLQWIGYQECAFFGVSHPDNDQYACREIWTKFERDEISRSLVEAQDEIEDITNYPLSPKWQVNEQQRYRLPLIVKYGKIIAVGVQLTTTIATGVAVSHAADPAVVTLPTTLTSIDNIYVFYPGVDLEIIPSSMGIAGGILTINIPRCRMVGYDYLDNPKEGWDYTDLTKFQQTVDVKLITNDPSTQATMIWPHGCSSDCSANGCSEYTEDACAYVRDPEIGILDILPAEYSGGTWTTKSRVCCGGTADNVRINYLAGLQTLTPQAEATIIRLAHAKLPNEPCGCDVVQRMWRRDTNVPDLLTRERLNCPFGLNDGAWVSWRFAHNMKLIRAGVFV